MSVVYIALPLALVLGALGLLACIACIRGGQFDDLDTPPLRMLLDDHPQSKSGGRDGDPQPKQTHQDAET